MSGKIFIASKVIADPSNPINFKHLYLVYASDGDITNTTNLKVIRGGFEYADISSDNLILEIDTLLTESKDAYNLGAGETYLTRGSVELNIGGRSADTVWNELVDTAKNLSSSGSSIDITGSYTGGGYVRDTGLDYEAVDGLDSLGFTNNSNATIRSILAANDISLETNLPSNMTTIEGAPGHDTILGSAQDDLLLVGYGNTNIVEHIDGDTGFDTANFGQIFTELNINLTNGKYTGIGIDGEIINIEKVIGSNYNDSITGDLNKNIIFGGNGNDILDGKGDMDTVYGNQGADTIIFRVSDNSFFAATDELLYGGVDSNQDILQIEMTSAELSNALKDEVLALYYNWTVVNTAAEKGYDFSILKLQAYEFEKLTIIVDGQVINPALVAKYDDFALQMNSSTTGNLFADNGLGIDYTFGSTLTTTSGVYTTALGGTITLSSDGFFSYASATGYTGVDSFAYTVTDTAGYSKTASAYFNVQQSYTGNDTATATSGYDEVLNYTGSLKPISVNAGAGKDEVRGSNYSDYINGQDGNDFILAGSGNDKIFGGNGDDHISGDYGTDTINGDDGNDNLYGVDGNDYLSGGNGIDNLYGGNGVDYLYGGIGDDKLNGDEDNDYLYGEDGNDQLKGGGGKDYLYGGDGNDQLNGDSEDDYVDGGDGDDIFKDGFGSNDLFFGGNGNDTFYGSNGLDYYDGGNGIDNIKFYLSGGAAFTAGIHVDLLQNIIFNDGYGKQETILNMENIETHNLNDTIIGNDLANTIFSYAGNDTIYGHGGNDRIYAGDGNNTVYGGDGDDTITVEYGTHVDIFYGDEGNDIISAGFGDDFIYGGTGNDILSGEWGNDLVEGGDGNDKINGGSENDRLYGGNGNDIITSGGSLGDIDYLYGGDGLDTLKSGAGSDTFVFEMASAFNNRDIIESFNPSGNDRIDISDLLTDYNSGTDDIHSFVKLVYSGTDAILSVDRDGTDSAYGFDQVALISNKSGLDLDNLLLNGNMIV